MYKNKNYVMMLQFAVALALAQLAAAQNSTATEVPNPFKPQRSIAPAGPSPKQSSFRVTEFLIILAGVFVFISLVVVALFCVRRLKKKKLEQAFVRSFLSPNWSSSARTMKKRHCSTG